LWWLGAPKPKLGQTRGSGPLVTTFVFRVRNLPAALYKAMGGFATNGVNMTKLESYMVERQFLFFRHAVLRRCRWAIPDDKNLAFRAGGAENSSRAKFRIVRGLFPAIRFPGPTFQREDGMIGRARRHSSARRPCERRDP